MNDMEIQKEIHKESLDAFLQPPNQSLFLSFLVEKPVRRPNPVKVPASASDDFFA
jgi:hypothetical protein